MLQYLTVKAVVQSEQDRETLLFEIGTYKMGREWEHVEEIPECLHDVASRASSPELI